MLRPNQEKALQESISNDFKSGIHFHATGTGKSWISLELILKYNKLHPNKNVLWLCEQKTILIEQFKEEILREKGYSNVLERFTLFNFSDVKPRDWHDKLNILSSKPKLIVINRSFLVSQKKYEKIEIVIDLIIHDECHSIVNKTTREFYQFILKKYNNISCIGFSATPCTDWEPFKEIITTYTIYDAYCDDIIVPPKIKWIESAQPLDDRQLLTISHENLNDLYYKKIIVWCGIIEKCNQYAELWKTLFPEFSVYIDTSLNEGDDFDLFSQCSKNAILFCACKHREGSDIKYLDGCIFLDKVENRNAKTFIQCIGRTLRIDVNTNKKYGLVLDLKASSCIKICDRMNEYLNCNRGFPWTYFYKEKKINKKKYMLHELCLQKKDSNDNVRILIEYTIKDVVNRFVRKCPNNSEYQNRLIDELELINEKKLASYLIRAVDILKITNYIPHVTRGSCGSSLVCYLLGISNVDPIQYDISFARFLNEYRSSLPDIDFDFPHYLRDEVFLKLELNWPNQVARISNHVHWHEKSALREALRKIGINKQIPKETIDDFVKKLPKDKQKKVKQYQDELNNTFRHYSLHCGGIIFFHNGVPDDLVLNKNTLSQIIYDKRDVSKTKNFKIDILSSRGLSQLIDIIGNDIDFNDCPFDENVYAMLHSGDNLGITLGESPLMRKTFIKLKPKSIKDLAICLAIIRPAAKDTRAEEGEVDYDAKFIFDDDAITLLSTSLNIDHGLADKFRRCIAKGEWDKEIKIRYDTLFGQLSKTKQNKLTKELNNLRAYSFCKAHSYSYAQLVYKLAYCKYYHPFKFWRAALKNSHSFYRKWVHLYEACRHGVDVNNIINKSDNCSIYAETRRKRFGNLTTIEQIKKYGYWNMTSNEFFPNCYFYKKENEYLFCGLIASSRVISYKPKTTVCFIGVKAGKFIEIIFKKKSFMPNSYAVKGRCKLLSENEQTYDAHIVSFLN